MDWREDILSILGGAQERVPQEGETWRSGLSKEERERRLVELVGEGKATHRKIDAAYEWETAGLGEVPAEMLREFSKLLNKTGSPTTEELTKITGHFAESQVKEPDSQDYYKSVMKPIMETASFFLKEINTKREIAVLFAECACDLEGENSELKAANSKLKVEVRRLKGRLARAKG